MPKQRHSTKPDKQRKLAQEHVDHLFKMAAESMDITLGTRYVSLARKVAMKFKLKLKSPQKRMYCPHCYTFLLPGKNLRVRVGQSKLIYYCLECKRFWRKPLNTKRPSQKVKKRNP